VISWSEMGKEEPICALGTLMYFIEYGEKYSAMPEFFDPAFKRKFESIMKTLKAPSKKGSRCDYTLYQAKRAGRNAVVVFGQAETAATLCKQRLCWLSIHGAGYFFFDFPFWISCVSCSRSLSPFPFWLPSFFLSTLGSPFACVFFPCS